MGRKKGVTDADILAQEGGLVTSVEVLGDMSSENDSVVCGVDITKYKLSKLEVQFVIEYMNNGLNATGAVMTVFGLKRQAAKARAQYLLNNGRVFPVLQLLLKNSVSTSLQFSPALLMTNIQTWLQYDIRNYYDDTQTAIPLDDIDEEARQLISGVDYTINGRTGQRYVTYRLPDKYKALQELSSIVKFLQSINAVSAEDESEVASKRDEIFGRVANYRPAGKVVTEIRPEHEEDE
jgi:hypothetical protein